MIYVLESTPRGIRVQVDGRSASINGEQLVDRFVLYTGGLRVWDPPNEDELVDDTTKALIIAAVEQKFPGITLE
jgi:hypothetical protein